MFARLKRLIRGFFSLFIGGLEEANPEALMEAAKQEFREKMVMYNKALARMAGVAERLKSQIGSKKTKSSDLERRVMANHKAGNIQLAGSLARELQELKADLAQDQEELIGTEEAYENNLRQAKIVRDEFDKKLQIMSKQLSQVKIKEAQAEAAAALSNTAFSVGDIGDTMGRVSEVLDKRLEEASGKARLAKDMVDMDTIVAKESEQRALEESALADFLAEQGVVVAPQESAPLSEHAIEDASTQKSIGPEQETQ